MWEISQTFEKVFGSGSLNNRVRMVYASWSLSSVEQEYFNNTLTWLQQEHGPLKDYVYAIAAAQYELEWADQKAVNTAVAAVQQGKVARKVVERKRMERGGMGGENERPGAGQTHQKAC